MHEKTASWLLFAWNVTLASAIAGSILVIIIIFKLPTTFDPYHPDYIEDDDFTEKDKALDKHEASGYGYFAKNRGIDKTVKTQTSVQIVVLGDIGRSPRMQYHARSFAQHGSRVFIIGYHESEVLAEIRENKLIEIVPLPPIPPRLKTDSAVLFPLIAPLKVLFQIATLYYALSYRTRPTRFMLVQNPPAIPTLFVAQIVSYLRNERLVIDWHNLGHTLLAMKLGDKHLLVRISELYEQLVAKAADGHLAVSTAMCKILRSNYGLEAQTLYDRPAQQFQPLSAAQRSTFLARLPETQHYAKKLERGSWRLLVSSTSWTSDEDFSILLDALIAYSATVSMDRQYPNLLVIITGKGPLKEHYEVRIKKLEAQKRLSHAHVLTAWLSMDDYASLLGSADLGVSLHTSSSGVDLPMKVVDMFGAGLPVVGWSKFEAWPELVKEGFNGRGFTSAEGLERLLEDLFGNRGRLDTLRKGALQESGKRWADEWDAVGTSVFKLPKQQ